MVDVPGAPDRLEQRVGEAQRHQVLHRLLAQVVVDAEHLGLAEHRADGRVDLASRLQRATDRLLQHDARVVAGQAGDGQVLGDGFEQVGGGGQVVDAPAITGAGAEEFAEPAEFGGVRQVHGEVVETRGEAGPGVVVEVAARHLGAHPTLGQGLVLGAVQHVARHRQDAHVRAQAAVAMQVVERRQQLVQGQVAGTAKHQHVTRTVQREASGRFACAGWAFM
jgi:hypothetical protein